MAVHRSADPGPPDAGRARMARIKAKAPLMVMMALEAIRRGAIADEVAQLAQVARVGVDDGKQGDRDYGPGIQLRLVRARRGGGVLRDVSVQIEEGAAPDQPNVTVRRARRVDPLTRLAKAGTINRRQHDAADMLRDQVEASESSMMGGGGSEIHVPPYERIPIGDKQVKACGKARRALAAVTPVHQPVLLWVLVGGTVDGYASYARIRQTSAPVLLQAGLTELADHYYGRRDHEPS